MDVAHKKTDEYLAKLEKRINKVYAEARDEMSSKIEKYFDNFKKADEKEKARLDAGEITKEQYQQWRMGKMARGKRFEAMRDDYAERMTRANEIALAYVNQNNPAIYSLNHNFIVQEVNESAEAIARGVSFTLYNEDTVRRLIVEDPALLPPYYPKTLALRRDIDIEWGKKQIANQVRTGILMGESIPNIAKRIQEKIPTMNRDSAIRSARTAATNAENAGRQAGFYNLAAKGVETTKKWLAARDHRTRDAHREADGQIVNSDEPFEVGGEELMYPGDGNLGASGWNIWNCRCTCVMEDYKFHSVLTDEQRRKANIRRVK